jgi:Pyruvate/2-oxoacid:ferredoxin oxidoreductase gamma subunit
MSPLDHPEYRAEADKLIVAANAIKDAAEEHGVKSTMFTMVLLGELMKTTQVAGKFISLPKSERDEFLAEVWDAGIGNEPNALVKKVAFFEGDALEKITDGLKAGALSFFNKGLPATPA